MAGIKNLPLAGTSAADFYKLARAFDPQFAALTQSLTLEQLQAGYAASPTNYAGIVNDWTGVVLAMRLQKITVSDYKDIMGDLGIMEAYENEYGAITERLYIHPIEALEPAWLGEDGNGLQEGDTVDPWIVMRGGMDASFWKTNLNWQAGQTIQEWQHKQIISTEYGMDEITAGMIRQLYVAWGKFQQLSGMDCLNALLNSEDYPLQATQKLAVGSWTDTDGIGSVTPEELTRFLAAIGGLVKDMQATISSGAYNAAGYDTAIDTSNMVVLMRPEVMNAVQYFVEAGIYNPDKLNLPIPVKYVKNFGGMIPTNASGEVLYPVRTGKLKRLAGWATTEGAAVPTIPVDNKAQITWVDPNEEVLAVIIQKGAIFTTTQNGIRVRTTPVNERGEYYNVFFNVINAGLYFDPHYNVAVITKPGAGTSSPSIAAANAKQIARAKAKA